MTVTARDIMTGDILRARLEWTVDVLTDFLTAHSISGAPVVSAAGRLVGVVSLTDVARSSSRQLRASGDAHEAYLEGPAFLTAPKRNGGPLGRAATVADIMTPHVFDVPTTATVPEIAQAMLRGRIHRVFVVEAGMIVGIISSLDLLRVLV